MISGSPPDGAVSGLTGDWQMLIAAGEPDPSPGREVLLAHFLAWYKDQMRGSIEKSSLSLERLEVLARWTVADVYAIRRMDRIVFLHSPALFAAECRESMNWAIRFNDELIRTEQWLDSRSKMARELTIDQDFLDLIHGIAEARVRLGGRITASDVAASANRNLAVFLGKSCLPRRPTHLLRLQQRLVSQALKRQLRRQAVETVDPGDLAPIAHDDPADSPGYLAELQEIVWSLCDAHESGDASSGLTDCEAVAFHDRYLAPDPRPTQKETAQGLGVSDRMLRTYLKKAERKVDAALRRRGLAGGFASDAGTSP
jgi:hypothetical protein